MEQAQSHDGTSPQMQMIAEYRSGILPPPAEIERYEAVLPGITDRLMKSYEKQSSHRMELEDKVIEGDSKRSSRGQIFAFIISMTCIVGGFYLIIKDKSILGIASILSALAVLSAAFYKGNSTRSNERKIKNQER